MQGKDYKDQIARLRQEQDLAIKDTDEQTIKWEGFKSDYEALKQRLTTLPDEVTHDVMVPFGKMAFMPGRLVHTNEILVLLGDNWFAERSAKQAVDIVNRRVKQIDKQLEELDQQRKLLEPRRDFTSDLQDFGEDGMETFDLREEYEEEKERLWKEQHKERVKKHRKRLKEDSHRSRSGSPKSQVGDEDVKLWERLDELERIENEGRELEKIGIEDGIQEQKQYPRESVHGYDMNNYNTTNRHTANVDTINKVENTLHGAKNRLENTLLNQDEADFESDECTEATDTSEELDSDDEESFSEENEFDEPEEPVTGGKIINFSHSSCPVNRGTESTASDVIHPGTLYTKFCANRQPKSILKTSVSEPKKHVKKKKRTRVVEFDTGSDTDEQSGQSLPSQQAPAVPAFTGTVVEKQMSMTNTNTSAVKERPVSMPGSVVEKRAPTTQTNMNTAAVKERPVSIPKRPMPDAYDPMYQENKPQNVKTEEPSEYSKPVSRFKARKQNKVDT